MNASSAIFCVSPFASLPCAIQGAAPSRATVRAIRSTLGIFIVIRRSPSGFVCGLRDGSGFDAGAAARQLHLVSHQDVTAFDHEAVERELAFEPLVDTLRNGFVADLGVRIVGGHDAARAEILHADERLADTQAGARPFALAQAFDAAHHDVGPQAAAVVAEGGDGAVRRDQERQDVETLGAVESHEARAGPADLHDVRGDVHALPGPAVHQRLAVRPQRALVSEEARMGARGDHLPARVLDVDDAVAFETERPDAHALELLAGHGLDRIPPDLG